MCGWVNSLLIQDGWTPLILAVHEGHVEVVEALLAKGADTDAKTPVGWFPETSWFGK